MGGYTKFLAILGGIGLCVMAVPVIVIYLGFSGIGIPLIPLVMALPAIATS